MSEYELSEIVQTFLNFLTAKKLERFMVRGECSREIWTDDDYHYLGKTIHKRAKQRVGDINFELRKEAIARRNKRIKYNELLEELKMHPIHMQHQMNQYDNIEDFFSSF